MLEVVIRDKTFRAVDGTALTALRDLSFTVATGSFTCLVGPSGCGKTTALRLILGLDRDFDGHVLRSDRGRGRVAAVFQEPRLLPWRTVDRNIRLALTDDAADIDLSALYATLGLTELANFYPGALSGGLARRVGIARAFAVEPSLLVLDEPFVSLDERLAARLRRLLITVWSARPTTALMVTHNLSEAIELADQIVILTPRPGTLSGIYRIDTPRDRRDPDTVAVLLERLMRDHPGLAVPLQAGGQDDG